MRTSDIIVGLGLLVGSGALAMKLVQMRKPPPTFTEPVVPLVVTVETAKLQDFPVMIRTSGEVRARTQSAVVPEVSGRIVEIGPNFREGGFFEKDDLLLRLDSQDYASALTTAESAVATAQALFNEEEARAAQALQDWKALGRGREPSPLVARKPQLADAAAKLRAAQSQLEKAQRDLDRTTVKAPYAGRVLSKTADVGQYVQSGREVGTIFAVDYVEIPLPLNESDLAFFDFKESYRGENPTDAKGPPVKLSAVVAGKPCEWEGRIIRSSGVIDSASRQLYVTAQVEDPYARKAADQPPLKVGQWVEARIQGRVLKDVVVVPRQAVRDGNEVLVVAAEKDAAGKEVLKLRRRTFERLTADENVVVLKSGLKPGEKFCTTMLSYAVDGASVKVRPEDADSAPMTKTEGAASNPKS